MKKFTLIFSIFLSVFLFSCQTRDAKLPKEVLSDFFEALGSNNIDKAKRLATSESAMVLDKLEDAGDNGGSSTADLYDNSKMQFGEAIIKDDQAIVPVTELSSGEVIRYKLKRVDGSWKVAFDKASLMNASDEAMPAQDDNDVPGELKTMTDTSVILKNEKRSNEQIENTNMDSAKKALERSLGY